MPDESQGFILNAERHLFEIVGTAERVVADHLLHAPHGEVGTLSAEIDEDILKGQPVYIKQNGHLGLAFDNQYIGVSLQDAALGHTCQYAILGAINRDNWKAIADTLLLQSGQTYYLSAAGKISNVPPETGILIVVGIALSTTILSIQNQPSIIL